MYAGVPVFRCLRLLISSQSTETYTGTLNVSVTAVANISFHGASPVTTKVELTMPGEDTTQTAHLPAVGGTSRLNTVPPPPPGPSMPHEIRLGLIGVLLLRIAATVAAIPSSESEERREPREG